MSAANNIESEPINGSRPLLIDAWYGKQDPVHCGPFVWLCGPHSGVFVCTLILLFGNAVIFSIWVALKIHWVLILIVALFLVGSIIALFSTTCTDPGSASCLHLSCYRGCATNKIK